VLLLQLRQRLEEIPLVRRRVHTPHSESRLTSIWLFLISSVDL
jgi:hypothetical protein